MIIPLLDWIQLFVFIGLLILLTPVLGRYIAFIFKNGDPYPSLSGVMGKVEHVIYRFSGIQPQREMDFKQYSWSCIGFHVIGFLVLFLIQRFQSIFPLNADQLGNVRWDTAFNAAASFITNTNWQSYSGETTMSHFTQMMGFGVQNFISAAVGLAVAFALIRGLIRKSTLFLGNFWVDVVRVILYLLLPLSFVWAVALSSQGVIQNFLPTAHIKTLEGEHQYIAQGPVASQVAIKQLGTNGGGFFGSNSAHPYENPTPLSHFLELLAIVLIPSALVWAYGDIIGNRRHGWIIWSVMFGFWLIGLGISIYSEMVIFPHSIGLQAWEGKEVRVGIMNSLIWSVSTTAASNGSVSAMMSSLSPLAGGVALFNMVMGSVIFGGVGSGLYGMILFILMTLFIAGLMVGRTPEYLGKKLGIFEMKMVLIALLLPNLCILLGAIIGFLNTEIVASLSHDGGHGFTELFYAFASAGANNGSSFAGLSANTPFLNVILGVIMIVSRFAVILPILAIAGHLGKQKSIPESLGTLRTDTVIFGCLLGFIIFLFAGLTFLPALSLGPILEHIMMIQGAVL